MARKFKYRASSNPDDGDPYPAAPRIPVIFKGKNELEVLGIVDSGATETILPLWLAQVLELELNEETEIRFVDRKGTGYSSKLNVFVEMEHGKKVELTVPCIVLKDADEIVIGRAGFFNAFEITFRENKKEIVLKYMGKATESTPPSQSI